MKSDNFPQHDCGGIRRFQPKWFDEFKWLEYSVHKDAAYYFICYLFKDSSKFLGGDAFVEEGFRNWNMKIDFVSMRVLLIVLIVKLNRSMICLENLIHPSMSLVPQILPSLKLDILLA
jgi:hypothetical protein